MDNIVHYQQDIDNGLQIISNEPPDIINDDGQSPAQHGQIQFGPEL